MRCLDERNTTIDKPIPGRLVFDTPVLTPKAVPSRTRNHGNDVERIVTEEELDDENFRCEPRKTFKIDCNRCWCARNGKEPKSCTRIACHSEVYPPLNSRQRN